MTDLTGFYRNQLHEGELDEARALDDFDRAARAAMHTGTGPHMLVLRIKRLIQPPETDDRAGLDTQTDI